MLNIKRSSSNVLRNLNSILRVCEDVFETVLPSITEVNSILRADMKNVLTLSIALAAASFIPNVYASGARGDTDEKYDGIPGAGDCWAEGYDIGLEFSINKDRLKECETSIGNPYFDAFVYGCIDAGNTRYDCENLFADM